MTDSEKKASKRNIIIMIILAIAFIIAIATRWEYTISEISGSVEAILD